MNILMLLGVLLTIQWGPPCGTPQMLVQGTPVPMNQLKKDVRLSVVQPSIIGCTTTVNVGPGTYVFAIWVGQLPPTWAMGESNRVHVEVYPNGTFWTDSPAPVSVPTPTNLRTGP